MKTILLPVIQVLVFTTIQCTPCSRLQSVDITTGVLHDNSSVIHKDIVYKKGTWYEVVENGTTTRLGCPCMALGVTCLHKCCGEGQAFANRSSSSCTNVDSSVVNPFSPDVFVGTQKSSAVAHKHFHFLYSRPCDDFYGMDSAREGERIYIQENGTLLEVSAGQPQWHPPSAYCVDMMLNANMTSARLFALICFQEFEEVQEQDSTALNIVYSVGLLISVAFLLATLIIYGFTPELRNLHGMCLMSYCSGLIVGYILLAYLRLHIGTVGVAMGGCYAIAFIVYFSFQTSFFWLNVMCFDIWRTFSGYRGGSTNKRREMRRFLTYGIYAWGVPLLLTGFLAIMQFSDLPDYIIKPGFGSRRCWFFEWASGLVYFFTPVLILVICNVTFFTITAYRIRSIRQETAILKGAESSRSDKLKKDKQRYGLYLKLFVVMGVNWSVEIISFFIGGSNWYWIFIDLSNVCVGILVFFLFVWKKKVRNLVQKRYRKIFGLPGAERDQRTGKWMTTSTAPTEDTRISSDESAIRLKDLN